VKRKLPLRLAHLQTFANIAHCTGTYDDYLMAVLLSCTFYGCHRMGELVQKNDHDLFDWRKIIKRASICFEQGHVQYPPHTTSYLFSMYAPSPMKFGVCVDLLLNGVCMDFCSPLKFLTLSTQQRSSQLSHVPGISWLY
jgi:hypothetical protein